MKVLVTGGAGFIGSHIVEQLVRQGETVRVLDDLSTGSLEFLASVRSSVEFVQGDVADLATVREVMHGITHVIHEAAMRSIPKSIEDPAYCNRINVDGTLHVLMAAREAGVRRIVFASSSSVYGDDAGCPAQEDNVLHPNSPYAVSKLIGELYARLFVELYQCSVIRLRYFNVFGPRMDGESGYAMAVPRFITAILRDESPPVFGDGQQRRDFIYVENIATATVRALDTSDPGPSVFNIGSGQNCSIIELVAVINRLLGKQLPPKLLPAKPGEARQTLADTTRARDILKFTPSITMEEGLTRTIAWFRAYQSKAARS